MIGAPDAVEFGGAKASNRFLCLFPEQGASLFLKWGEGRGTSGLPWWLSGKESACKYRSQEFAPWSGKKEMATQFSILCLGNPSDRGAWWATVYRLTESYMT